MAQNVEHLDSEAYEPQTRGYSDLWGIAWRHRSLVALGIVVGLLLGALYYAMRTPGYRSEAQVLVIKKRPDAYPLTGADARAPYADDYLSTHQVLIKSPLIVGRAIHKGELHGLRSFAGSADLTKAIIRSLTVNRELKESSDGSNILNLSFRCRVGTECGAVLNAIIDSYKDFLDETYKNVSDDTLELITKARDLLRKDLAQKETDYRDFRQKAPLLWRGKDGASPYHEKLASIEAKRGSLLVRRAEIEGRLAAIEKALQEGRGRMALLAIMPELPANTGAHGAKRTSPVTLQEQLLPLLHQEQVLLEDYGPNHPQVQSVRKRIEITRKHFARPMDAWNDARAEPSPRPRAGEGKVSGGGDDLPLDPMEIYVQSLKQELQDIQLSEQLLAERFQDQYEEARKLTNHEIQNERFRNDIERTHQLYDSIIKRLQELNLARDYGGYDARTIAPAGDGIRVEPNATVILTASALLGILGGFGLAYLADRTDKSFRTPEEVRRRLGLPIVGHIPLMQPAEEVLPHGSAELAPDPLLWAYYRPQSQEAESYRGVRTALYFGMHGKEHRVVQITSPDMGDGKTILVANLGISIAQLGQKTLLIDADFRRSRLHNVLGVSAQAGLASVLKGEAELNEVIQACLVPGLSVLPCGAIPPNPAELLASPRFKELLDTLRLRYDFVLIDTPPLLAVTDPCVVAPRVDAILLSIRVSKNGRPHAERAKEILNTLGVAVLGVVVNGMDSCAGVAGYGYGYQSYHYRDGYAHSNGCHSGDGEDRAKPDGASDGAAARTGSDGFGTDGEYDRRASPLRSEKESAIRSQEPADRNQEPAVRMARPVTPGPPGTAPREGRSRPSRWRPNLLRRLLGL